MTSGLAFIPLTDFPTYCAAKAAIHSYTAALRESLRGKVEVIELVPPCVQTELTPGQPSFEGYMPLDAFIEETMAGFGTQPTPEEIVVGHARMLRGAERESRSKEVRKMVNAHRSD